MNLTRTSLSLGIAGLFAAGVAHGQPIPWITETWITVGGIVTDTSGRDTSRIEEYQDLDDGVLSNFGFRGNNASTWVEFYAENVGRDDMYAKLRGGGYGRFSYSLYANWLPHNHLFEGRTPLGGNGTGTLTPSPAFPRPDPSNWNAIDIATQRKDWGGHFEWQANSPWYARIEGNNVTQKGTSVGAAALGTSPGNGFIDLAFPTQFTTRTATAEVGYATSKMQFALSYTYSRFENDHESFQWTNPYFGSNLDTTFQPYGNNYQRIGANAVFRQLPMNSTFSARYTWSMTQNDGSIPSTALTVGPGGAGTGAYVPTLASQDAFDGEYVNQTLSLALNSSPARNVDTKLYYNWYKMDNNSSQVTFADGGQIDCGGACSALRYDYTKNNVGAEAIWRVNRANRVSGGWDYLDVDQNRVDYDHVTYNKLWAEYKNTSLENASFRAKYHYLQRRGDFLLGDAGTGPNDPVYINRFIARYDNADLDQNAFKLTADWSPAPLFDLSGEAIFKNNDYKNTTLGRTKDRRYELFGQISFGDPSKFRVTFMADYEWVKYDSYHRNISDSALAGAFDPSTPPTSANYNWSARNEDDNWLVGVAFDWPVNEKFMLKGSLLYFKSDGDSTVSSENNFGNPQPIEAYDDWKQTQLNVKGIYALNRNWSFTGGYAYTKSDYSDIAFNGYQHTIPFPGVTTSFTQSYLNGYRAFTNADANIFYLLATYRF
jgi:MtrB/PioB family decaheme-associated outer membrane protein